MAKTPETKKYLLESKVRLPRETESSAEHLPSERTEGYHLRYAPFDMAEKEYEHPNQKKITHPVIDHYKKIQRNLVFYL